MTLLAAFYGRDLVGQAGVAAPVGEVTFSVERLTWRAMGGPKLAQVRARGRREDVWGLLNLLRCPVLIYDETAKSKWWGMAKSVEVQESGVSVKVSLDSMANRVRVYYGSLSGAGIIGEQAVTDWVEDTDSSGEYGDKERQGHLSQATDEQAEAYAAAILGRVKYPVASYSFESLQEVSALIECMGWWDTLEWVFYEQLNGKEGYEDVGYGVQSLGKGTSGTGISFGKGMSGTNIAFSVEVVNEGTEEETQYWIRSTTSSLEVFDYNEHIQVSGSVSNNGNFTIIGTSSSGGASGLRVSEAVTTEGAGANVSIRSTDDHWIRNTVSGLGIFQIGEQMQVSGSVSNNGIYTVMGVSSPSDGTSALEVSQDLTVEGAGASVNVRSASKVGQSLQLASAAPWQAAAIRVRLRKEGAPTDRVRVALYTDSSGAPGTMLAEGFLDATVVDTNLNWHRFELDTMITLSLGTTYWVMVEREGGAVDDADYYKLDINTELGYPRGECKVYFTTWTARVPDADLLFIVEGVQETSSQIEDILEAAGQFFAGIQIEDDSGLYSSPYRSGENTALACVTELLESGTINGLRMLAEVDEWRQVRVFEEVAMAAGINYLVRLDGTLEDSMGRVLRNCELPAGVWMKIKDAPMTDQWSLSNSGAVFVEEVNYDGKRDRLSIRVRDEVKQVLEMGL